MRQFLVVTSERTAGQERARVAPIDREFHIYKMARFVSASHPAFDHEIMKYKKKSDLGAKSSSSLKVHFSPLWWVGQLISLMAVLHAFLSVGSMWILLDALPSSVICFSRTYLYEALISILLILLIVLKFITLMTCLNKRSM